MTIKLFTLARPSIDMAEVERFLEDEKLSWRQDSLAGEAERLTELAGRICYMSFGDRQSPRSNAEYLNNVLAQGHESVLEHVSWTFLLTGVTRSFTHQLVRHRPGMAYSQLSQQYLEQQDADVAVLDVVAEDPAAAEIFMQHADASRRAYASLLESLDRSVSVDLSSKERNRLIRTAARGLLPEATTTKIVVTANARALRHFWNVRGNLAGDPEMRAVSALLYRSAREDAPALFDDFVLRETDAGYVVLPAS